MKFVNAILSALAILVLLTAVAMAEPNTDEPYVQVLQSGTAIVSGYPNQSDFYVVSENEMPRLVAELDRKRELDDAKVLADQHEKEHAHILLPPGIVTALNDVLKGEQMNRPAASSQVTFASNMQKAIYKKFHPVQLRSLENSLCQMPSASKILMASNQAPTSSLGQIRQTIFMPEVAVYNRSNQSPVKINDVLLPKKPKLMEGSKKEEIASKKFLSIEGLAKADDDKAKKVLARKPVTIAKTSSSKQQVSVRKLVALKTALPRKQQKSISKKSIASAAAKSVRQPVKLAAKQTKKTHKQTKLVAAHQHKQKPVKVKHVATTKPSQHQPGKKSEMMRFVIKEVTFDNNHQLKVVSNNRRSSSSAPLKSNKGRG